MTDLGLWGNTEYLRQRIASLQGLFILFFLPICQKPIEWRAPKPMPNFVNVCEVALSIVNSATNPNEFTMRVE
jgi:hypothetical protein